MNEKKTFTFDGVSSERFGLWISGAGTYVTPQKDVTMVSVPGRNGDLQFDNGRFKNVAISYKASGIIDGFQEKYRDFTSWALSKKGYKRLEDDYRTDIFRLAILQSPFKPSMTRSLRAGRIDISFECKPQMFLKSGETLVTVTASRNITNPTLYNAKPLIRVYGSGRVTIGSYGFSITNSGPYTDIDCDLMNAYNATDNLNRYLTVDNNLFPEFVPGTNRITLGSGITKLEITPRWWTL